MKFVRGSIYEIDYLDHATNLKVYESNAKYPATLRCIGKYMGKIRHANRNIAQFETWRVTSDPEDQRIDYHEVVESCILKARKVGK